MNNTLATEIKKAVRKLFDDNPKYNIRLMDYEDCDKFAVDLIAEVCKVKTEYLKLFS